MQLCDKILARCILVRKICMTILLILQSVSVVIGCGCMFRQSDEGRNCLHFGKTLTQ